MAAAGRRGSAPAFRAERRGRRAGPEPRGPGPGGPLRRAAGRRADRPHRRRPGRDRPAQPAAGRGPRRAGRHATRPTPPAARLRRAETHALCADARPRARSTTRSNHDPRSAATACATSCSRCSTTSPGATSCRCSPARPSCSAEVADLLDALADALDPTDGRATWPPRRAGGRPRACAGGWRDDRRRRTRPTPRPSSGCWPWPRGEAVATRGRRRAGGWPAAVGCDSGWSVADR